MKEIYFAIAKIYRLERKFCGAKFTIIIHYSFLIIHSQVTNLEGFPSGQRGRTVNPLAELSVVRIHLPPP